MTAIAAIRVDGMPVLIGDLLLSSEIAPAPTINLPSLGEIPSRFTVDARRYVAGLRQKICLVTPDLAAAWSGCHCDAADVLTLAKEHFEFHSVSDESLRNFFEHYARTQGNFPSSLALLCAFHDRAKGLNTLPVQAGGQNHILRFQSPRFGWCELAGSGRTEIKKHLLAEYGHELALGQVNVFSRAFAEAVSIGNRLLVNELTTGLNVAMGFGGGFETCLFRKDRFAKMGGILNLYWEHQSVSGKHQFRLISPLTKISYVDDILVILRMDFNTFNKTGLILTRYVIEPADRNISSFERDTAQTDWEAPCVANTVIVRHKEGEIAFDTLIDRMEPPSVMIREEHGEIGIIMNDEWLQSNFTRIKRQVDNL